MSLTIGAASAHKGQSRCPDGEGTVGLVFLQDAAVQGEEEKGTYKGVATKNLELPRDRLLRGGEKTKGEGC